MSSYTLNQIKAYAKSSISELLPLDDETVTQMVDYAVKELRTRDAVSQHFTNLLGESSKSLEFITQFSNMLFGDPNKKTPTEKKVEVKTGKSGRTGNGWTLPKPVQRDPHKPRARLNRGPVGTSTSEMLTKQPSNTWKKKNAKKTLENLQDLEGALNELEVSTGEIDFSNDQVVRVCNCNATRHPLFEMFPNCLNCGKIICAREGFQPCSFCGKPLLTNEERLEIIGILQKEKDEIEGTSEPVVKQDRSKGRKKGIKISINSTGQNNYKVQERAFRRIEKKRELERKKEEAQREKEKEVELEKKELDQVKAVKDKDEELVAAEKRLDTLMNFQDNGIERTKIIDQASDYDASTPVSLWASPLERALQLKQRQRLLRHEEEAEDKRSGRGKKVMSMSIRNGKVYMHEEDVEEDDGSERREIDDLQAKLHRVKAEHDEENSHNLWDYESDATKWQRPQYIGKGDNKENEGDADLLQKKNVVQLGDEQEQEDAIFSMIGV